MNYSTFKNLLDSLDLICMILSKVPGHLQDRWNRNALEIIKRTETRKPGLLDLTNFVEDEMILVNDPLFSKEAVRQYDEKPWRPQNFQKHQTGVKITVGQRTWLAKFYLLPSRIFCYYRNDWSFFFSSATGVFVRVTSKALEQHLNE